VLFARYLNLVHPRQMRVPAGLDGIKALTCALT
jgi:hypothetical protein